MNSKRDVALRVSAKEAYADWMLEYGNRFHTYATFTFPETIGWSSNPKKNLPGRLKIYRTITPETALKRGRRLRHLVNELCCGKRFRERNTGILSVIAVEVQNEKPHLHTMWEHHPLLTSNCLKGLWRKVLRRWTSSKAIDVQSINDLVKVTRYTTKHLSWETTPFLELWKPKRQWKEEMLSLRAVKKQLTNVTLVGCGKQG